MHASGNVAGSHGAGSAVALPPPLLSAPQFGQLGGLIHATDSLSVHPMGLLGPLALSWLLSLLRFHDQAFFLCPSLSGLHTPAEDQILPWLSGLRPCA